MFINDKLHLDKLEEYNTSYSKENINYNRHKHVSYKIIKITKMLLSFFYNGNANGNDNCSPDIFQKLKHNFQHNLHNIVTLKNAFKLLKILEPFELNYAKKDNSEIYVFQDLFRYGTYDSVTYVMKKYKHDIVSTLYDNYYNSPNVNGYTNEDLLETLCIMCNNSDARLLKIYIDFLETLITNTKSINKFLSNGFYKVNCENNYQQFMTNTKSFKIKVNILLSFF